jgi:hypothetical protein
MHHAPSPWYVRVPDERQICPACFKLIPADALNCPACGADIVALSARNYREKLIAALQHPLAEVRMRAIIALGWRGETEAAEPLVACALRHPVDVVEGLEIVHSLASIYQPRVSQELLARLVMEHPAHAVRESAAEALAALSRRGEIDA